MFIPNPHYAREIRRLRKAVSETPFKCDEGCSDCCTNHVWTWTEWLQVPPELRREAISVKARCPYATAKGCAVYEYRSIVCRLHALGPIIGDVQHIKNVSLCCQRGYVSPDPLPRKVARDIFLRFVGLIHKEARDQANMGVERPLFAGPYGKYAGRRD